MASNVTPAAVKPPRENLYRINPDIALDRSAGAAMPTMTGHFAVWNQWTEIRSAYEGHFMERFAPGAMQKTLAESTPKVLFQHGKDPQVGDKVLGIPSRVQPDGDGAYYEVPLFDTSYNRDLLPGLEAGAYGASFRFSVVQEDFNQRPKRSAQNPNGLPERTVTEAKVIEFGPVTFPAYPGASAGVRSITDDVLRWQLGLDEDEIAERARRAVKSGSHNAPVRVYFNGDLISGRAEEEERADTEAIGLLNQMQDLANQYLQLESDEEDAPDRETINQVLQMLAALVQEEQQEPDDGGRDTETDGEERAQWTAAYIDSLPDSSFLHIEAGGKKDSEGKTTPRSLRHFPVKDAQGNVDMPHLRNALARIPQSNLPASVKAAATAKAQKMMQMQGRAVEPEPHGATTHLEPEPSAATTRRDSTNLFWFVDKPSSKRSLKK